MYSSYILKGISAITFVITFNAVLTVQGQSTSLFDDTKVCSVLLSISGADLNGIYNTAGTGVYFPARFIFVDGSIRDTVEQVGVRLRGNTSLSSAKKSFKISFNTFVSGRKYQDVKKINLNGNHNDPTMIREKLYYDIWNRFGLPNRRVSFAKLYINNEYMGLYSNLEEMDKDWLDRSYEDNDGNLYKCTYPAPLVYIGENEQDYKDIESSTASGGRAYDLQTNEAEDDYSGLIDLIRALDAPANEAFQTDIAEILNVNLFLKALAVEVICGHWDNYAYNKNNYYLYQDPVDGLFDFITYDGDNTMGVDWIGIDWTTQDPYNWIDPSSNRPLYKKMMAIPDFKNQYSIYLDSLVRFIVKPDSIFPRIDALHTLITPAAVDDIYRTLDYGYTIQDFHDGFEETVDGHTPYGIKPYFENRLDNLNLIISTETPTQEPKTLTTFPNPASDVIYIPLPGADQIGFISVISASGQSMNTDQCRTSGDFIIIPVASLPDGMYFITLQNNQETFATRFIKLK